MDIKTWMNAATKKERARMAAAANTTVPYLWQLAGGHRNTGYPLAMKIVGATTAITPDRIIKRCDLRPDIWPPVADDFGHDRGEQR